jgi:large subunit ribosomal protein L28
MQPTQILRTKAVNTFKRAQRGLFAGKHIQFGNNKPFSLKKTRRVWLPNIQRKRLFSQILGKEIQLKVTTAALRTIDKKGGLDNYLLYTRDEKLQSELAIRLKRLLEKKLAERKAKRKAKRARQKQRKLEKQKQKEMKMR